MKIGVSEIFVILLMAVTMSLCYMEITRKSRKFLIKYQDRQLTTQVYSILTIKQMNANLSLSEEERLILLGACTRIKEEYLKIESYIAVEWAREIKEIMERINSNELSYEDIEVLKGSLIRNKRISLEGTI